MKHNLDQLHYNQACGIFSPMKNRGVSLLEVIFSTFIISFVCISIAVSFPMSELAVKKAEITTNASNLAEAALETARSNGFEGLLTPDLTPHKSTLGGVEYVTQLETFAGPPGSNPQLIIGVRATVKWTFRSEPKSLSHELLVNKIKT